MRVTEISLRNIRPSCGEPSLVGGASALLCIVVFNIASRLLHRISFIKLRRIFVWSTNPAQVIQEPPCSHYNHETRIINLEGVKILAGGNTYFVVIVPPKSHIVMACAPSLFEFFKKIKARRER